MGGEHTTGVIDVDEATLEDLKDRDLPGLTRELYPVSGQGEPVAACSSWVV